MELYRNDVWNVIDREIKNKKKLKNPKTNTVRQWRNFIISRMLFAGFAYSLHVHSAYCQLLQRNGQNKHPWRSVEKANLCVKFSKTLIKRNVHQNYNFFVMLMINIIEECYNQMEND